MADFTYLSTTIPYVNAPPHVGFALELVQTDAVARYLRLCGDSVITSTGSDDHALKNVRAAERRIDDEARAAARLGTVLNTTFATLAAVAVAISPFLPALSKELENTLNFEIKPGALDRLGELRGTLAGVALGPPSILAPRLQGRA